MTFLGKEDASTNSEDVEENWMNEIAEIKATLRRKRLLFFFIWKEISELKKKEQNLARSGRKLNY